MKAHSAKETSAPAPAIPTELEALIARAERHQERLGLNDAAFATRFGIHVKTVDSWSRTLKGRDPDRLTPNNYARWLTALRKLVAEIDGVIAEETVYPSIPMLTCAVSLYDRLQASTTDRRVAWLIGQSGSGKSVALRHLRRANPRQTALAVVTPLWRESQSTIADGLAAALGVGTHRSTARTWAAVVEHLKGEPMTLLLDEVHEGGVLLFKMLKTLINQALPARCILATLPTGFRRVENATSEAYDEARQLLGRSLRPFYKQWELGLRQADVAAYLAAATDLDSEDRGQLARELLKPLSSGGMRLLADAIDAAQRLADADQSPLTTARIRDAIESMAGGI